MTKHLCDDVDLKSPVSAQDDLPVYDRIASRCDELTKLYDGASPAAVKKLEKFEQAMDEVIAYRKTELSKRRLSFSEPRGDRVSGMIPRNNRQSKHKKQRMTRK